MYRRVIGIVTQWKCTTTTILSQLLDLGEQKLLLLCKLLVLRFSVLVKPLQIPDHLVLVHGQDVLDRLGLVRIGHKHFEHVERLELDVLALVQQQVHHELEVVLHVDVSCHDTEVGAVQQDLAQELYDGVVSVRPIVLQQTWTGQELTRMDCLLVT